MPVPPDKYDELRLSWIKRHKYVFTFQDRRAQILARQIRDRDTERSGARVDPSDDDVLYPVLMLQRRNPWDAVLIGVAGILAPIGWIAARIIYKKTIQLILSELRAYPIAAYAWSAVGAGLLPLWVYEPTHWAATTIPEALWSMMWTVLPAWLVAQIPAAPLIASIYGILEGWLAIDGSRELWPKLPPRQLNDIIDFGFGEPEDMTRPPVFPPHREDPPGDPTPIDGAR
jgi:hypothetical protein